jgi:hypothetical protein
VTSQHHTACLFSNNILTSSPPLCQLLRFPTEIDVSDEEMMDVTDEGLNKCEESLRENDDQVRAALTKKMKGVPTRVYSRITTRDIYTLSAKLFNAQIPPDLQLEWYLRNWKAVRQFRNPDKDGYHYTARKECLDRDVSLVFHKFRNISDQLNI